MRKSATDLRHLKEVSDAVQRIWYSYAEGFLPKVTGTTADNDLYNIVDHWMPKGWTASVQPSGSVYVSKPILTRPSSMHVLVIEKRANGEQRMFEIAL